jgi:two-component system sensor histidine kinase VanS
MPRSDAAGLLSRPNRLTVRMRLTLTYALLFTVAGSIMLALIYAFMRYVPTYAITPVQADAAMDGATRWQATVPSEAAGAATYQPVEGLTS